MGNRGRKSAAALSVVPPADPLDLGRPDPPAGLTVEQATEWRAIVCRMASDRFPRETHALLADYCRRVCRARRIARLIEKLEHARTMDVDEYDKLARMADRESRTMLTLATGMRMTQYQEYAKEKTKGKTRRRPWEE